MIACVMELDAPYCWICVGRLTGSSRYGAYAKAVNGFSGNSDGSGGVESYDCGDGFSDVYGDGCGDGRGDGYGDPLPLCDDTLVCAVRQAARPA